MYFNLKLRKATRDDFLYNGKLIFGKMYFVHSLINQELQGPHHLFDGQDREEFGAWLKDERIYVPVSSIEQDRKPKLIQKGAMA